MTDRLTRQMAEFDNFRKRTEREKSQMYEIGAKDIIEKILPVIDNFERGLAAVPEESKEDPFVEGMEKIYKQIMTTLEGVGVKPIEAVGQDLILISIMRLCMWKMRKRVKTSSRKNFKKAICIMTAS